MNSFRVVWSPEADSDLASIWLEAEDRAAITRATDSIEQRLSHNPEHYGAFLSEGFWAVKVQPLIVYFQFAESANRVDVAHVRRLA